MQTVLVEDPKTHELVVLPSNSPENAYAYTDRSGRRQTTALCVGSTFDQQITRDLLKNTAAAARILEIDEEFAKTMGLDSIEAVRSKIKEGLESACEQEATRKAKQDVISSVVEDSTFEIPDGLINMGLESMLKSYRQEYEQSGEGDIEAKLDQIRERLRPLAINLVKEQFIIDDIARRENIKVENSEIEEVMTTIANQTGTSIDETRKRAAENDDISRWRRDMLKDKVLGFLLEHADIEQ